MTSNDPPTSASAPPSAGADIEALKERFLNLEFDRKDFVLEAQNLATVARQCGETLPQYTEPGHADFQALPSMIASLASGRFLPIDFPRLGGIPMDGGKAVSCRAPVRPGVALTGRTHLHDIYAKQGRSGRMIFLVSRMELSDPDGVLLAISDSRMVIRERHDD